MCCGEGPGGSGPDPARLVVGLSGLPAMRRRIGHRAARPDRGRFLQGFARSVTRSDHRDRRRRVGRRPDEAELALDVSWVGRTRPGDQPRDRRVGAGGSADPAISALMARATELPEGPDGPCLRHWRPHHDLDCTTFDSPNPTDQSPVCLAGRLGRGQRRGRSMSRHFYIATLNQYCRLSAIKFAQHRTRAALGAASLRHASNRRMSTYFAQQV